MRVVSRWCRCVVQRLCATDCKHPCLVRAVAPHSAPARTPGVYAQMLCTMQSQPSIHSLSPGEGIWGFGKDAEIERPKALQDAKPTKRSYRDREQALFGKNRLFLQAECNYMPFIEAKNTVFLKTTLFITLTHH